MSYYPIELDKIRNFKYGMKAISLIEKSFKKPIHQINYDNLTMKDTAVLIWAGLQHEDKNLTPDKVMDLVDEHSNVRAVMPIMMNAINSAFGIETEEIEKEKNK